MAGWNSMFTIFNGVCVYCKHVRFITRRLNIFTGFESKKKEP